MLAFYSHLSSNDANDALARMRGVAPKKQKQKSITICPQCDSPNKRGSSYCHDCGLALTRNHADTLEDVEDASIAQLAPAMVDAAPAKIEALIRKIIEEERQGSS